jgi:hypothetical protein
LSLRKGQDNVIQMAGRSFFSAEAEYKVANYKCDDDITE